VLLFHHTFHTPEENLAADEALLEDAEASEPGAGGEVLRLWESPRHFVTLGYTNKIEDEADTRTCAALGVPILRRASGGGTVLQGPRCWNYALILSIENRPEIATISGANCWIMRRQARAIQQVLASPVDRVEVAGHTDLAINGRKFSGNAQKRKRRCTLFHGTFLLRGFDVALLERTLKMPARRPDYRAARPHADFVHTLDASPDAIARALASTWGTQGTMSLGQFPHGRMQTLIKERYARREWNKKF
jgi:lipoate-protein ligase A